MLLLFSCSLVSDSDLMNWAPPGSSVHGIFWARLLEWLAVFFSRGSFQPRDQPCVSMSPVLQAAALPLSHQGSPSYFTYVHMEYLSFSPLLFVSLLFTAICKASSDSHFTFLHFYFLGMVLIPFSCTMSLSPFIVHQALCPSDLVL